MPTTVTWMLLSEAFAHVLSHEGLDQLAQLRLLTVFGDGRVHTRAGYMILEAFKESERTDIDLSEDFWGAESARQLENGDYVKHCPDVTWSESRASTKGSHPLGYCAAYRIEVNQQELFAIWPSRPKLKAGRKPKHDPDAILDEAEADWRKNIRPESLEDWQGRVRGRLEGKWPNRKPPERSYLMKLLGPLYKKLLEESAN